ncbi:MAG TPA: hypothetical protein VJ643_03165 [Nitrososphaera sp.]|nr:hypothetical protein [Nitrososphaera sp.]
MTPKMRRRRVRDKEEERKAQEEEREKTNASIRRSAGQSGRRRTVGGGGGGERVRGRRWDYMTPFSGRNFGLASEDWLRGFDETRLKWSMSLKKPYRI